MSRETIVVYKCDRCGKRMDSPYASFNLKRNNVVFNENIDFANKDLCVDCFDKIASFMDDPKAMIFTTSAHITVEDMPVSATCKQNFSAGNDPLNKHLNVTCV